MNMKRRLHSAGPTIRGLTTAGSGQPSLTMCVPRPHALHPRCLFCAPQHALGLMVTPHHVFSLTVSCVCLHDVWWSHQLREEEQEHAIALGFDECDFEHECVCPSHSCSGDDT